MTKFTKRQYLAAIAANEAALSAVKAEIEVLNARFEAGEEVVGAWNAANGREWELGQERWAIERRWTQRNWTGADYAFAELVAANID
jgi:hypothetical protein